MYAYSSFSNLLPEHSMFWTDRLLTASQLHIG